MVRQKAFAGKLLIVVTMLIMFYLFDFGVFAAEIESKLWDGLVTLDIPSSVTLFKGGMNGYTINDGNYEIPDFAVVDYYAEINGHVNIDSYEIGTYLNGSLQKRVTFSVGNPSNGTFSYINVTSEPIIMDDLYISLKLVKRESNNTTVDINIQFDNYFVSNSSIVLPIYLKIDAVCAYDLANNNNKNIYHQMWATRSVVDDYSGTVESYDSILDVPSMDGQFAQQNQNIIDNTLKQNELQEEANNLQEESNETQKNIFEKITDFFDNFFSRLGDFLLGLIVPSSDDLTAFLDEVNAWFSDRLGFIWYPFGFAVDAVSALAGGDANTQFTVPALQINMLGGTYTIWNEMSVDIDAFDIFKYVRLFTSFICVGGIVALAYNKWDEWIGGHGVG